ncbi:MAG TPA: ROK family transcriptional regulator [Actinophytocola sp.]|uniref:ROK family transcriptional regulator n=1 Tax=Actinophytocola sp. TaxID=1872138 RepID=UPI002DDD355D|nr:ROK family transcriptional regulator [Actinophytocola sp.]HEV2779444.1 ROK family transcriptional regulator [Actinophytocola sp.]
MGLPPQARLLRVLRDRGAQSRAELGDLVELSRSKVAAELDRLTELGLVEEAGLAESRGGRRPAVVRIGSWLRFVGVNVGATSVDVAVTDGELELLEHVSEELDVRDGPQRILGRVVEIVGKFRDQGHLPQLHGLGIGLPGPVSFRDGVPYAPPIMPGWDQHPVRDTLTRELGCPVLVDNDVNVMALGEKQAGVAKNSDDFLFVKIGTGVGCGILVGGEVYRGANGSAGDIGHIQVDEDGPACSCGNLGCLEAFFSGAALARSAQSVARAGESPFLAMRLENQGRLAATDVAAALAAGDPVALRLVREGGRHLGLVLAGLVSFFNPSLIVIGGGVAGIGHVLLAEIRSAVYRRSLPLATNNLPLVMSELGEDAGVIGAARMISDLVYSRTSEVSR